jgi:hypothetical protein
VLKRLEQSKKTVLVLIKSRRRKLLERAREDEIKRAKQQECEAMLVMLSPEQRSMFLTLVSDDENNATKLLEELSAMNHLPLEISGNGAAIMPRDGRRDRAEAKERIEREKEDAKLKVRKEKDRIKAEKVAAAMAVAEELATAAAAAAAAAASAAKTAEEAAACSSSSDDDNE